MDALLGSKRPFRMAIKARLLCLIGSLAAAGIFTPDAYAREYEIRVLGTVEETIELYKQANFWGEVDRSKPLDVPRAFIVVINKSWSEEAKQVSVPDKKELFFRGLVPLVLYANELIVKDRTRLEGLVKRHKAGETLSTDDLRWLRELATTYGMVDRENPPADEELLSMTDELLMRVDIIPPALALGQGAYESGYATSRFTLVGNALFGQWTYGGKGIKPKKQRKSKGDYGVASFLWPLDSVRAYVRNLNTHRAYEELRRKRAELRRGGQKLTGVALAETLTKYSEKGQTYVDTLKSIIRVNELDVADSARLRDEPAVLIVSAESAEHKAEVESEIESLRASGELEEIIKSMRLEED